MSYWAADRAQPLGSVAVDHTNDRPRPWALLVNGLPDGPGRPWAVAGGLGASKRQFGRRGLDEQIVGAK